ncbi:unnamed protein product [Penicillium egyptiacum]|uniref:Uncharacterized protein n=1 Tax=Penicillium egyptiacum TaxID=1303716 RepID=A0A9W4KAG3_9EURO|nr:unnamed protein product [Penicillium egyptiacum]
MFSTIRRLSLYNHSKFLEREFKRLEEIKRGNFASPADSIMAYQNHSDRLKTENQAPSCEFALGRLLNKLRREILEVPFIQEEVKYLGRPVDYRLFIYYCRALVDESRKPSISAAEASNMGDHGEARGRSHSSGRHISYRSWRRSTKGRSPDTGVGAVLCALPVALQLIRS